MNQLRVCRGAGFVKQNPSEKTAPIRPRSRLNRHTKRPYPGGVERRGRGASELGDGPARRTLRRAGRVLVAYALGMRENILAALPSRSVHDVVP
jgi:hypothetical protein